jgi:hypothetical protein
MAEYPCTRSDRSELVAKYLAGGSSKPYLYLHVTSAGTPCAVF